MPIYEYLCHQCGEAFEKMVPFSEADRAPFCPKCQSQDTYKKVSKIGSFGAYTAGPTSLSGGCGSGGGFS